ncbi:hypothetical protein C5C13_06240 [Clavibacter michiganensis]|nr:hypothetical protein C5C13_06240 [Clavibacter michiganensis]
MDEPDSASVTDGGSLPRELTREELELAAQLAGLILAGILRGAVIAAPHMRRWLTAEGLPWGRSVRTRLSALAVRIFWRRNPSAGFVEEAMFAASTAGVAMGEIDDIRMSSAEWERRFRAMLEAGTFAQEQMRVLSIARLAELQIALEGSREPTTLTATQFIERVNLMFKANPILLNTTTAASFTRALTPGETRHDC